MKFETKSTENYFSVFLKFKLPFVKRSVNFRSLLYKTPETWVCGYSSRTQQGKYVLFHDYDNLSRVDVIKELKFLQETFGLSDYYLFELDRENSFHAVCLDTFSLSRAYEIQKATSCDLAFIHSVKNLQTKEWVLRLGKKGERGLPKYVGKIKEDWYWGGLEIKSTAHANLLRKFGVPVSFDGEWDNCKKLSLVKYNTFNRVD